MPETLTLTLEKHAYGGEALGYSQGKAIFVPFALPGETVRVELVEDRPRMARARLLEVLSPSPQRIAPRCQHFGLCGGCAYQHLAYPDQLALKTQLLRDQLIRIAKLPNPPVKPAVASPQAWNYRNNLQFHLTEEGRLGFVGADGQIFPAETCHLPEERLSALWPNLHFEAETPLQRVALRAGEDLLLSLESDTPEIPALEVETEDLSIVHLYQEHAVPLAGEGFFTLTVLERPFRVSAASFFQVNTRMAEELVKHVLALLPAQAETLLDVYCGVGLFSAFLAPRAQRLVAVELSPSACEDFAFNLDEFDNVELYQAAAEAALPALKIHPDAILLDPPRAGLERPALDAVLNSGAPSLVYVSCDPATLARDTARLMAGGYSLRQATPFDLFPQTYHLESVCLFTRERSAA